MRVKWPCLPLDTIILGERRRSAFLSTHPLSRTILVVLVHFSSISSLEKERKQSPVRECANNKGVFLLSYPAPQAHPIEDTKLLP